MGKISLVFVRTTMVNRRRFFFGLMLALLTWQAALGQQAALNLPRFTEEREAAALFFVKKHLAEMVPVLDQLKKDRADQYQKEISQIFQVTEILADLREEMPRHDLELKIWIAENRASLLAAKLSTPSDEERKKTQDLLQEVARQLVALDIEHLEMRAEQLERELGEVREELTKSRENRDKLARERYEELLQRGAKRKLQKAG